MLAKDIMTRDPVCVDIDDRLPQIKQTLEDMGFHHLPVVEDGVLVGIISDRDLLRMISPFINSISEQRRDTETLNHAAHQVMTRQPITVSENTPVEDIVGWMKRVDISCIPVVDADMHLLGMVTWHDLINHATFK